MTSIKGLPLRINFSWMLAGNMVYAVANWAILSVLARLGNPAEVGRFALALSITAPVILLSQLALRQVQVTDAGREFRFSDYLLLRLLTTGLAISVIIGLALTHQGDGLAQAVIILVGCAKGFEALSDIVYSLFQKYERMEVVARSTILRGLLPLLALALAYALSSSLSLAVGCYALGKLAVFVLYDWRVQKGRFSFADAHDHINWRDQIRHLPQLVWIALPLGLVASMISAVTALPRIVLEDQHGAAALGIFSSIAYLIVTGNMVVNALGQSALPRLTQHYTRGERQRFVVLLLKLLGIGVILACGGILLSVLIGPTLLNWLYGPEYAAENRILVWLSFSAIFTFMASFLGYGITAGRYFTAQLGTMSVVLVATILFSLLIVPRYGLMGAAVVVILASIVRWLVAACVVLVLLKRFPEASS